MTARAVGMSVLFATTILACRGAQPTGQTGHAQDGAPTVASPTVAVPTVTSPVVEQMPPELAVVEQAPPARGQFLTLLYSSNLRGEYEPCG